MSVAVTSLAAHIESDSNLSERPYHFCSTIILNIPILIHSDPWSYHHCKGHLSLFVCTPVQMKWSRSFSHEDLISQPLCIASEAWHEGLSCAEIRIPLVITPSKSF